MVNAHIEYHVDCTSLLADIEARFVETDQLSCMAWSVSFRTPKHNRRQGYLPVGTAEALQRFFADAADAMLFHHDGTIDTAHRFLDLKKLLLRSGLLVLFYFWCYR